MKSIKKTTIWLLLIMMCAPTTDLLAVRRLYSKEAHWATGVLSAVSALALFGISYSRYVGKDYYPSSRVVALDATLNLAAGGIVAAALTAASYVVDLTVEAKIETINKHFTAFAQNPLLRIAPNSAHLADQALARFPGTSTACALVQARDELARISTDITNFADAVDNFRLQLSADVNIQEQCNALLAKLLPLIGAALHNSGLVDELLIAYAN